LVAGFFAVDAIKQEQRTFPARFSRGGAYGPQPSLRVNDVTIMSPSRIITIATDRDLYDSKRNRGDPSTHRDRLSPASRMNVALRRASFPRSVAKEERRGARRNRENKRLSSSRRSHIRAESTSEYCSHTFSDMMHFLPSISDRRSMLL